MHRKTATRLGIGLALYVIAAILPVLLLGVSDQPNFPLDPGVAISIGLVIALIIGAIATAALVGISGKFAPHARLQERRFSPDRSVIQWVNELARENERRLTTSLTVAVSLWVLSSAVLIIVALAPPSYLQSVWITVSTVPLLFIVAIGLFIYLRAMWASRKATTSVRNKMLYLRARWASSAASAINRGIEKPVVAPA